MRFNRILFGLYFFYFGYFLVSYLLFLRDDFILERISLLTGRPGLLEWGREAGKFLHINSLSTAAFVLLIPGLFFFYFLFLKKVRLWESVGSVRKVVILSLPIILISLFSFPALSTDVFDYISANRVLFVHHANPWLVPPQDFPQDEFIYLGSWNFRASVYGPVQFIFSSLIQLIGGNSIILNLLAFKLVGAGFFAATAYLIFRWLREFAPRRQAYGLALFLFNPLVVIEILGNAHNDLVMGFFTLLAVYLVFRGRVLRAAVFLALAVLAKISCFILAPAIAVWLEKQQSLSRALKFSLGFIVITALGFLSLGEGLISLIDNLGVQLSLYLHSLPTLLRFLFQSLGLVKSQALLAEKAITLPIFFSAYLFLLTKLKKNNLISVAVALFFCYLIFVSPMLQPWYLVWLLPLVALLPPSRLQLSMLIFSLSSLLHYTILFISFYLSPLNFGWQAVMFLVAVIPPLAVWLIPSGWYTWDT